MTASIPKSGKTLVPEIPLWQSATWEDYRMYRDDSTLDRIRLFFNDGYLLVEMGSEGINHAKVSDLLILILGFWFSAQSNQTAESLGRCLLEKPKKKAGAPDLVLYVGGEFPQWQPGEPRRINLDQWRVPDLVGEISDTTLATDLDEKKDIYAALGIPEYWVVDVIGLRVIAFQLQEDGKYQQCTHSLALTGLPISLLDQTLQRLSQGTNISAATWFGQQIANLKSE
ncbi:MAG: Uma2 family endonuclease [Cyanothece sp. SIO1E1]|nr:Uma2 family endonuclease [Cyanothece sp. SIO1E1]